VAPSPRSRQRSRHSCNASEHSSRHARMLSGSACHICSQLSTHGSLSSVQLWTQSIVGSRRSGRRRARDKEKPRHGGCGEEEPHGRASGTARMPPHSQSANQMHSSDRRMMQRTDATTEPMCLWRTNS
jgi:hypothetical protein